MTRSTGLAMLALTALSAAGGAASAAEPVLVQCGREYQAARAAGTLNGVDWNHYRLDCAARLKNAAGTPAVAAAPAAPQPAPASPPPAPAAAQADSPAGGRAAAASRQKLCGAEWRAGKAALVAQTPGLTWPRYWSQCNARLKAAS